MNEQEVRFNPQSMDARVWAKEFMRLYNEPKPRGIDPNEWIDEELMISWFANAIMAGYDEAQRKYKVEPKVSEIEKIITPLNEQEVKKILEQMLEEYGVIEYDIIDGKKSWDGYYLDQAFVSLKSLEPKVREINKVLWKANNKWWNTHAEDSVGNGYFMALATAIVKYLKGRT